MAGVPSHTLAGMLRDTTHTALAAGWVLGLGTVAWAATFSSSYDWPLLLAWGLLPPLLLIRLRQQHWHPSV